MAFPPQRSERNKLALEGGEENREEISIQIENSEPELLLGNALTRIQIELNTDGSIRDFWDEFKSMRQAVDKLIQPA